MDLYDAFRIIVLVLLLAGMSLIISMAKDKNRTSKRESSSTDLQTDTTFEKQTTTSSGDPPSRSVQPSISTATQANGCPVCGDYPGRRLVREIKYACPFCEAVVIVREADITPGKGIAVLCRSCRKSLQLPAQIWCPRCKNGTLDVDLIMEFIAEENGVSLEQLKREGKQHDLNIEDLKRTTDQLNKLLDW